MGKMVLILPTINQPVRTLTMSEKTEPIFGHTFSELDQIQVTVPWPLHSLNSY